MHTELFQIGPFTIYSYGLMVAIGILAAYYVTEYRGRKLGVNTQYLDWMAIWVLVGGFACSKLLYYITRLPDIIRDPSILLNFGDGWVVYGGLIGGLLGGYLFCKYKHLNFWQQFDLLIPGVALAQGFGRLGCFLAGCCYGIELESWFSVVFPEGSLAPAGIPLFPSQLVSSAYDFLMFFVLMAITKKMKFNGELGAWYLVMYSIGRFIIEYFRGDLIRGQIGDLSTSQIIAIVMLIFGIAILVLGRKYNRNKTTAS